MKNLKNIISEKLHLGKKSVVEEKIEDCFNNNIPYKGVHVLYNNNYVINNINKGITDSIGTIDDIYDTVKAIIDNMYEDLTDYTFLLYYSGMLGLCIYAPQYFKSNYMDESQFLGYLECDLYKYPIWDQKSWCVNISNHSNKSKAITDTLNKLKNFVGKIGQRFNIEK